MSAKTFVDTNILVYAHDIDSDRKRETAKQLLRELWESRTGALSVQVLQEFYVTVTRKIPKPLSKNQARLVVSGYEMWCGETTTAEIATAFRMEEEAGISFWDAMILSCAVKSGATRLLSEDLNPGRRIFGVLVENPFSKA